MFVVLESKKLKPCAGFAHVKGYAGLAAGKPRGCSERVLTHTSWRSFIVSSPRRMFRPSRPDPFGQCRGHSIRAQASDYQPGSTG